MNDATPTVCSTKRSVSRNRAPPILAYPREPYAGGGGSRAAFAEGMTLRAPSCDGKEPPCLERPKKEHRSASPRRALSCAPRRRRCAREDGASSCCSREPPSAEVPVRAPPRIAAEKCRREDQSAFHLHARCYYCGKHAQRLLRPNNARPDVSRAS